MWLKHVAQTCGSNDPTVSPIVNSCGTKELRNIKTFPYPFLSHSPLPPSIALVYFLLFKFNYLLFFQSFEFSVECYKLRKLFYFQFNFKSLEVFQNYLSPMQYINFYDGKKRFPKSRKTNLEPSHHTRSSCLCLLQKTCLTSILGTLDGLVREKSQI